MNKQGKSNTLLTVGAVAMILVIIGLALNATGVIHLTQQTAYGAGGAGGNVNQGATCSGSNPSFNALGIDALVANQNVTPANYAYIVNEQYVGSTYANPVQGANVEVLADPTGYLATTATVHSVACGPQDVKFAFQNYANATVTIKTDTSKLVLTNAAAGGAQNETAITGAGGSRNWEVDLVGVNQKSTSKMFFYVELPAQSASNISGSGISMSCNGVTLPQVSIPGAIGSTGANAARAAFEVPSLDNGAQATCNVQVSTIGAKALSGAVYTKIYAEQAFVDADGKLKFGVYDSNSNAVYQDSYSYNFLMK